jgi:predicted DNA-binding transcriptional regulator YafY
VSGPITSRNSPAAGRLEAVGADRCVLHAGSDSLDELALYLALKGFDFQVLHPPELIPVLRALAERLARAAGAGSPGADTRLPARPAAADDGAGR